MAYLPKDGPNEADFVTLDTELSHIKKRYREIFNIARDSLFERFYGLKADYGCDACDVSGRPDDGEHPVFLETFHEGCGYRPWQRAVLAIIEQEIARDVLTRLQQIEAYKQQFTCNMCGVCCRLASSEFSFEELQEKAAAGDNFARQFTSIFLPYASIAEAQKKFPAIVTDVLSHVERGQAVHFYHCPYIGEDNRCTIYGSSKRPDICDRYPDTPLTFIYDKCAWKPWKDETHDQALAAHATIELCSFLLQKLKQALET